MKIAVMATGEIAVPTFQWLSDQSGHDVVGLVTQPDRPVGRKQVLTPPAVKVLAEKAGLPVLQPEKVRETEALKEISSWQPEVIVVMAYGQILPQTLIDIPTRAIINLHASLLPKYRGAACVQAPIREGDSATGWSVIHVVKKLDAGNVILQEEIALDGTETGGELHDALAEMAPRVLERALPLLEREETLVGVPQNENLVTVVPKLLRVDGELDWHTSAAALERLIRAYEPWPGTFTTLSGKRLKIFPPIKVVENDLRPGEVAFEEDQLLVGCGAGALALGTVQLEGSRRMSGKELWAGKREALASGLGR